MAKTPEGAVKEKVKKVLKLFGAYWHCPVQSAYGVPSLDFIGCINGQYFGIETKAANKQPTPRQAATMEQIVAAGGKVFLINEVEGLDELSRWCCLHVDKDNA